MRLMVEKASAMAEGSGSGIFGSGWVRGAACLMKRQGEELSHGWMIARLQRVVNIDNSGSEMMRRTTMDGKRFSKCTTNTSNNGQRGVAEDGRGITSSVV